MNQRNFNRALEAWLTPPDEKELEECEECEGTGQKLVQCETCSGNGVYYLETEGPLVRSHKVDCEDCNAQGLINDMCENKFCDEGYIVPPEIDYEEREREY